MQVTSQRKKNGEEVVFQYGEWLKEVEGRPKVTSTHEARRHNVFDVDGEKEQSPSTVEPSRVNDHDSNIQCKAVTNTIGNRCINEYDQEIKQLETNTFGNVSVIMENVTMSNEINEEVVSTETKNLNDEAGFKQI